MQDNNTAPDVNTSEPDTPAVNSGASNHSSTPVIKPAGIVPPATEDTDDSALRPAAQQAQSIYPNSQTRSQSVAKQPTFVTGSSLDSEMNPTELTAPSDDRPVPVVKVLSVRGVEYLFMTLSLLFSAAAFVTILLALINGAAGFTTLTFPISLLLVNLPIFAFLFLRLRKAELANPELRLEPSKRRLSQVTQTITFLVCVFTIVAIINIIVSSIGGAYDGSIVKAILNALVIFGVSGGLLLYYWFDEHRLVK